VGSIGGDILTTPNGWALVGHAGPAGFFLFFFWFNFFWSEFILNEQSLQQI
jgi:hypothetical protein